jgi:hypothetical protein
MNRNWRSGEFVVVARRNLLYGYCVDVAVREGGEAAPRESLYGATHMEGLAWNYRAFVMRYATLLYLT